MDFKSLWHRIVPDWTTFLRKCMPYVLVAVYTAATVAAVVGVQDSRQQYTEISGTQTELEMRQKELAATLEKTKELQELLKALEGDTIALMQQTESEKGKIAEKIEELKAVLEAVEDKEQQKWVLPIQYKAYSSAFGYREHPVNGGATFHSGVDLAADLGTPIVAARSGTVTIAEYIENDAGYWVLIDHMDGFESAYMHMDKYIVTQGQFVLAGQIIGYCGSSGIATDNHLHFEIRKDNRKVNPADYVSIT